MLMYSASDPAAAIFALTSSTCARRGAEVEVDAADPVARRGERERRGLAHPGGRAEDQRPALAVVGHRGSSGLRRDPARCGTGWRRVYRVGRRPRPTVRPARFGATSPWRCRPRDGDADARERPRARGPDAAGAPAHRPAGDRPGRAPGARDRRPPARRSRRPRREQGRVGRHHRVRQPASGRSSTSSSVARTGRSSRSAPGTRRDAGLGQPARPTDRRRAPARRRTPVAVAPSCARRPPRVRAATPPVGDRDRGPHQALPGRHPRPRRADDDGAGRVGVRAARPERRGQDHDASGCSPASPGRRRARVHRRGRGRARRPRRAARPRLPRAGPAGLRAG